MTAERLKAALRLATIVTALLGFAIILYVGRVAFSASGDRLSPSFHLFAGFYGGYLIYMVYALRKNFSPRTIHQYLSAIFLPVALVPAAMILGPNSETTVARALAAIAVFLLVGIVYKITLAQIGKKLFGKKILE